MSSEGEIRTDPRSYWDMAKGWFVEHKRGFLYLGAAFAGIQLFLNGLIGTHLYVYKIDVYSADQFNNVKWWMLAVDTTVWILVLWALRKEYQDMRGSNA